MFLNQNERQYISKAGGIEAYKNRHVLRHIPYFEDQQADQAYIESGKHVITSQKISSNALQNCSIRKCNFRFELKKRTFHHAPNTTNKMNI